MPQPIETAVCTIAEARALLASLRDAYLHLPPHKRDHVRATLHSTPTKYWDLVLYHATLQFDLAEVL